MPVKTSFVTEQHIRQTALPQHGKTYTVIPHGHVIDATKKELVASGFQVKTELYKCSMDGQIAQGIYHLDFGNDPDMGLMFAWSNSYNKSMRFKCAVGGHVFVCMNGVVRGDMGSFVRKHTGSALYDAEISIQEQIGNAKQYFNRLVEDKTLLKNIHLTTKEKGTILGRLFAEQEILTLTQVGIVKRELNKPSHQYNCHPDSAWAMYNHITLALKESHPSSFLQDHEHVHDFFINEYGQLITPVQEEEQEEEVIVETETLFIEEEVEAPMNAFGVTFL
jgi:hypothetical protein